jgi:hypothetical protein
MQRDHRDADIEIDAVEIEDVTRSESESAEKAVEIMTNGAGPFSRTTRFRRPAGRCAPVLRGVDSWTLEDAATAEADMVRRANRPVSPTPASASTTWRYRRLHACSPTPAGPKSPPPRPFIEGCASEDSAGRSA